MNQHARTSRGHARTGQSIFRILAVLALFIAVFATALVVGREVITHTGPATPDMHRGVVQLEPNQNGRCDKLELDNQSGTMRWKGAERCSEATTAVSGPASGSGERLNGISEHFRSR